MVKGNTFDVCSLADLLSHSFILYYLWGISYSVALLLKLGQGPLNSHSSTVISCLGQRL